MNNRFESLGKLVELKERDCIKVITGVRRCGKTSLLDLFAEHLLASGVSPGGIIRVDFEKGGFEEITDYKTLYHYVKEKLVPDVNTYILLDGIQKIKEWEKAVDSLSLIPNVDITITGSNACLLASEFSSLLYGRLEEIKMLPLSFKEYLDFREISYDDRELATHFKSYLDYGSLPEMIQFYPLPDSIMPVLCGIYNTVLMKEVMPRNNVRDVPLLESLVKFMASSLGKQMSIKKISDYLVASGHNTTFETVNSYLSMLEDAYILYRAGRYDLKGRQFLKTQEKYYFVDTGLLNLVLCGAGADYGAVLESVVYFELLRRGFEVSIGKFGNHEIDFVAMKPDRRVYYQVCSSIKNVSVRDCELKPLRAVPDNYEKVILSMDCPPVSDFDGIKNVHLLDFLLKF